MKRIKFAIIILTAVLIAAGGIFLISYYYKDKSDKEAKAEEEKLVMFDFDENSVDKIEVNNDGGQFISEYITGTGWRLTNTDEFEVNDALIAAMAANMCNLKAEKILDDDDTSKYGFDNPVRVTCYIGDEAHTIIVGDSTPTYENFYAMKENDDNIYLISFTNGSVLAASKNDLKQTYIYPYMSYDINHFALWEGKESDENVLFSMDMISDDVWTMSKPQADSSVDNVQIDEFLTDSSKDQISSFVQEGCDESEYSKFGFDNPQYVFEISTEDEYTKVIFGGPTEDGEEIYGLFTETGQVVTFVPNEISLLNYTTLDMMDTGIFSTDISNVANVTVTLNGKDILLDMSEGEQAYMLDGTNVSELGDDAVAAFITFFNSFNNAYYESVEKSASPSGDAEISVKYVETNNIVTIIEYIPSENPDEYYVIKNGEYTGFTITSDIIDIIKDSYNELSEMTK